MATKHDGGTPATVALAKAGVDVTLHTYHHERASRRPRGTSGLRGRAKAEQPTSYGEEAAAALGVDPARVFKTLVTSVDGALTVAIVPVAGQLDLKALARAVGGSKAVMADVAAAERATGYVAGGISPIGQKRRHPTVLDASALSFPTVYVSAGRRGLELEIAPQDLIVVTKAITATIERAGGREEREGSVGELRSSKRRD